MTTELQQVGIEQKIHFLQQEIRAFLVQVEEFYTHIQQQSLCCKVILHKQKTGLEKFAGFTDLYIPDFRWVVYIDNKRYYLDWKSVTSILDRSNVTLDERIFYINMQYEFQRIRLEVKSAVNRLKDTIFLLQELKSMLDEQNISLKMFSKSIA